MITSWHAARSCLVVDLTRSHCGVPLQNITSTYARLRMSKSQTILWSTHCPHGSFSRCKLKCFMSPHCQCARSLAAFREFWWTLTLVFCLFVCLLCLQADGKSAPDVSALEASLDLRVLSTVLELTKGQKLLSRCLAMLPPRQRSALVPSVLALTLARAPAATLRNAPSEQVRD